jgi:SAM-dependent methyltransferase
MTNIRYNSKKLSSTYFKSRIHWNDFYDSEKFILEKIGIYEEDTILDLGCACGGLGLALREKFGKVNYTGIDINQFSISKSMELNPYGKFYCGDILDKNFEHFYEKFNKVISFSCIDWNIEFDLMLKRSWDFVKPGGYLIASMRITDKETVKNINQSFQKIDNDFSAQYSIININEILNQFKIFNPSEINSYGYWGSTIKSYGNLTVSPYDKICFCVFSLKKRIDETEPMKINLQLPI